MAVERSRQVPVEARRSTRLFRGFRESLGWQEVFFARLPVYVDLYIYSFYGRFYV